MPSYRAAIALIALFLTLAIANPTPLRSSQLQRRSFKVERIPNPSFQGYDGPSQLLKAHMKFRVDVPPELAAAMNRNGKPKNQTSTGHSNSHSNSHSNHTHSNNTHSNESHSNRTHSNHGHSNHTAALTNLTAGIGEVTATPLAGDIEYVAPVKIGGQTLIMNFDTGSSDLWVFNTQLGVAASKKHTLYDPTKSTTFQLLQGNTFSISYGDGSGAAGNVGTDTVDIGGATVTQQAIELATAVSNSFVQDTGSNGLVGLAFSTLNTVKPAQQKTFFDNALATLQEPVFTADLRAAAVGAYEFGTIDNTKFKGALSWTPVNTTLGFWQFSTNSFAVGNGAPVSAKGGQAIADTGTTLMLVSDAVATGYYSQVPGAVNNATVGGITFPCNSVLPDLTVDIGGNYMATVSGKFINFAQTDKTGQTCFGGVQPIAGSLQIYGDIFFKSQFVAFNGKNNSIGMAEHQ